MNTIYRKDNLISAYDGKIELYFETDFTYNDNDIFLFIGPNGIGKSTLAKIITRFINYEIPKGKDFNRNFLFHPQDLLFLPGTVREDYQVFLRGMKFEDKIAVLGQEISEFYNKHKDSITSNLSGGEKQLILILRTILVYYKRELDNNVDGIVLDEPSKQLCNKNFQTLKNVFLKSLTTINRPLFFITHEFNLVQAILDVFLPAEKSINILEIKELGGKQKIIKQLGSFNINNIETRWIEVIQKSEYLASFFEHIEHNITQIHDLGKEHIVKYSFPFHSGLYKIVTSDNRIIISNKPKNANSKLEVKEQICYLN